MWRDMTKGQGPSGMEQSWEKSRGWEHLLPVFHSPGSPPSSSLRANTSSPGLGILLHLNPTLLPPHTHTF